MVQERLPRKAGSTGPSSSHAEGAAGYLIAGVCLFGGLGILLDRWLSVTFLTPLGIVIGGLLGGYLVYLRVVREPESSAVETQSRSGSGMSRKKESR
ncbi:MAG: hypothetical protein WAN48_09705 [Actinomycetes bacterium]